MLGCPVVVSLVFAGVAFWTAVAVATPPVAGDPYQVGSRLYVWAVQGINLRQRPSASAPVIDKLAHGTPVTVSEQDEPPVPHRLEFFPPRDAAHTFTQIAREQPRVSLDGRWIKIEAGRQDGYAFDKLLLRWPPKNPDEAIKAYLVRAFELTAHRRQKKSREDEESGLRYATIYRTWTSKENRVVLKAEASDGDASTRGDGGHISMPGSSFDEGFVLANGILPPLADHGFRYRAGQEFEYLLDQIGNTAKLKKTEDGISLEWYFGMN